MHWRAPSSSPLHTLPLASISGLDWAGACTAGNMASTAHDAAATSIFRLFMVVRLPVLFRRLARPINEMLYRHVIFWQYTGRVRGATEAESARFQIWDIPDVWLLSHQVKPKRPMP